MTSMKASIPMELKDGHQFLSSNWRGDLKDAIPSGSRVIAVCSHGSVKRGTFNSIRSALTNSEILMEVFAPETPDLAFYQKIFEPVAEVHADYIVAVGGGSVLDAAKAIKLIFSSRDWVEFQHQAENGVTTNSNNCQIIAIPTTAGSGSEFTPFATLWDREAARKLSIDAPWLLPDIPIVDPSCLSTLTGKKLLYPALDAISHSVESLWSKRKTRESREYALSALAFSQFAIASFQNGTPDLTQFALASAYAGKAIAISRTALAHSISYPLTLMFGIPHGLACSFTLGEIFLIATKFGSLDEEESRCIELILDSLRPFKIGSLVLEYCSIEKAVDLTSVMLSPGRSNNMSLSDVNVDLQSVLRQALSK
ncbi:iron-containing alcohol dehydrogenase [Actinomycetota bacterium]|nr:iron-containing alcohol dehydrogenase [Actinomycetota bacterium]